MFKFPDNLYTDVRMEDVYETKIVYNQRELEESRTRTYKAAFIRIFDGHKWYYGSTSDIDNIQGEIDTLSGYASPDKDIYAHPVVQGLQINKEHLMRYEDGNVSAIYIDKKQELLGEYFPLLQDSKYIKNWNANYLDKRIVKEFYSSKGAEIAFDTQFLGISIGMGFADGEKRLSERYQKVGDSFGSLEGHTGEFKEFIARCEAFLLNSRPCKPGKYTMVLSPIAAGVFAHESFGHKSEADFMIGDELMKKEWSIGKKVGSDILSIVDTGEIPGFGYTPFDDEGTRAGKTYLVKNGRLSGRLHSSSTAASLDEAVTGNARAISFEYEPIVRMTTTYIEPGNKTKEELISEVSEGIFIDTIRHGSGMSTFTMAPGLAYYIRDGKLAEPVRIAVITGNVMETLKEIDGLSSELELYSSVLGGCGKNDQYPLNVAMGGPYVRVRALNAQ